MQHVAVTCRDSGAGKYLITDRHYLAKDMFIKPWNAQPVPIRQVTRESFARAWNISIEEQLEYETLEIGRPADVVLSQLENVLPPGVTC